MTRSKIIAEKKYFLKLKKKYSLYVHHETNESGAWSSSCSSPAKRPGVRMLLRGGDRLTDHFTSADRDWLRGEATGRGVVDLGTEGFVSASRVQKSRWFRGFWFILSAVARKIDTVTIKPVLVGVYGHTYLYWKLGNRARWVLWWWNSLHIL